MQAKYIIESFPTIETYHNIPIITFDKLPKNIKNIIVIPFFDMDIIEPKVHKLRPDVKLWGINELIF